MRTTYPSVSPEQLAEIDDNCAICREHMESAKQLPCKHVFHEGCLRLWLEHHSSCPTCRRELIGNTPEQQQQQQNERRRWLPRFRFFQGRRNNNVSDDMVRAVQAVAPHVPEAWIRQDLARTGSPNATLERIFTIFPPPEDEDENRNIPIHREEIEVSDPTANNENVIEEQIKELTQSTPSGFANTAKERQKRLKERTELMKQKAKLLYLQKQRKLAEKATEESKNNTIEIPVIPQDEIEEKKNEEPEIVNTISLPIEEDIPSFSPKESLDMRRKRVIAAAERRRQSLSSSSSGEETQNL